MLYDPETSIATLAEQGIEGLEQFEEIFNAVPVMLCGLTRRGVALAERGNICQRNKLYTKDTSQLVNELDSLNRTITKRPHDEAFFRPEGMVLV